MDGEKPGVLQSGEGRGRAVWHAFAAGALTNFDLPSGTLLVQIGGTLLVISDMKTIT